MATPTIKRTRAAAEISPGGRDAMIQSLPSENCPHCEKPCIADNKAVQFDLCGVWVHVKCEGLPKDIYEKLNKFCEVVDNLSYYCKANHCNSRVKQLKHNHYKNLEQQATPPAFKTVEQSLTDVKTQIEEKIKDLSSQIQKLQLSQSSINMEMDAVAQSIQDHPASAGTVFNTTGSSIAG